MRNQTFNRDALLESLSYIDDEAVKQSVIEFAEMVCKIQIPKQANSLFSRLCL